MPSMRTLCMQSAWCQEWLFAIDGRGLAFCSMAANMSAFASASCGSTSPGGDVEIVSLVRSTSIYCGGSSSGSSRIFFISPPDAKSAGSALPVFSCKARSSAARFTISLNDHPWRPSTELKPPRRASACFSGDSSHLMSLKQRHDLQPPHRLRVPRRHRRPRCGAQGHLREGGQIEAVGD